MTWLMVSLLSVLAAACGGYGSGDPILGSGTGAAVAPTVTAEAPANNAVAVPINITVVTANFSEAVNPISGGASFTLTCAAPCASPAGTVSLDATNKIATFTIKPAANLAVSTVYTATVTGATSIATKLPMAKPFVWTFTTGLVADTTKPRVTRTVPATSVPGPTAGVPANTAITAVFTKDMLPGTITASSFTVTCGAPCVNPAGVVSYVVGSDTAVFTPSAALAINTTYTATITTAATDLAGNALAGNQGALPAASNYVWMFTTGTAVAAKPVSVVALSPSANAINVCPSTTISGTFSVPSGLQMDPTTITSVTFTVTGPGPAFAPVTAASVVLDPATGTIATFTPQSALSSGVIYTVTILGGPNGVKDLAIPANVLDSNSTSWNFTVGPATGNCLPPVNMGLATPFASAATAGVTNTPTAPNTQINGNIVLDPNQTCNAVTVDNAGGFGLCGGDAPAINGTVITNSFPDTTTAGKIEADLNAAFLSITPPAGPPAAGSLSGGTPIAAPTTLGGGAGSALVPGVNYFTPGVYISITSILITGDLTLDAQGDPNAQFIFQSASSLTTADGAPSPGAHARILLVNGAKASNVWWQVGSSATVGLYSQFQGNILAAFNVTYKTGASSCGRAMAGAWVGGGGAFVFDSNVISVPGNGCPP
jgi:hypothetical protein